MSKLAFTELFSFIKGIYKEEFIPLHQPLFQGNEKAYLTECIDSGFVSSVGEFVNRFEKEIARFCGSKFAIATSNGTSALHATLHALGINQDCEVLTQSLSFIATSNAIAYTGASPIYIDVDLTSLSLCPQALSQWLELHATLENDLCLNKHTRKQIKACVPMHTFGHPAKTQEIKQICEKWRILLIEDAAESLGSYHILPDGARRHTGLDGIASILSFNGNKTITCGGGGAILTDDEALAKHLKHLTTTAKRPHSYEYYHDALGFNYRMPNLNAALALAQLEQLPAFLESKREIAKLYEEFCARKGIEFVSAREDTEPNFWLNAIKLEDRIQRDSFLAISNKEGIMTRPIWNLNHTLPMYQSAQRGDLTRSSFLEDRVVNLPSSAKIC